MNNQEKELLLKLLMEKATKIDIVNLQLVETPKKRRQGSGRGKRPFGTKMWSIQETNFLKESIVAGISFSEIGKFLNRTTKAVESRAYLIKKGMVA